MKKLRRVKSEELVVANRKKWQRAFGINELIDKINELEQRIKKLEKKK